MGALRELTTEYKFESINIDYLLALSETEDGPQLVSQLIEVYLEHASELLDRVDTSIRENDYEIAQAFFVTFKSGSERIGASRLATVIENSFNDAGSHLEIESMRNLHSGIALEFVLVKSELGLLFKMLRKITA